MARPKKTKPTCDHCGRTFDRQGNLKWHAQTHAPSNSTIPDPSLITIGDKDMPESSCTNCHTLEHKIERKDDELAQMALELQDAATALRKPQATPGHQNIQELLDCPSCGPTALTQFEKRGGAILPPGKVKPQLIKYVKKNFPIFEKGITLP
tara:strand:+ start:1223 stop:1678 length:456 start_codon:yes stop_codon:yes gene_type:complete